MGSKTVAFHLSKDSEYTLKLLEQCVFVEVGEESCGHGLMTKFMKVWPAFLTVSHKLCGLASHVKGFASRGEHRTPDTALGKNLAKGSDKGCCPRQTKMYG
jgi:hypothetical protein